MTERMTFPKPERRKTTKARQDRHEAAVEKQVREAVVERDGHCRISWEHRRTGMTVMDFDLLGCKGDSQFCHLPPKTRAATRKMPPEERHGTAWTLMACKFHHDRLDGRQQPRIVVRCLTPDGADGPITVEIRCT
jgi:hypothetical protein